MNPDYSFFVIASSAKHTIPQVLQLLVDQSPLGQSRKPAAAYGSPQPCVPRDDGIHLCSPIDPACKYYQRHTGEGRYPVARIARPFDWIPGQARNDEVHTIETSVNRDRSQLPFGLSLSKPVLSLPNGPCTYSDMPFDRSTSSRSGRTGTLSCAMENSIFPCRIDRTGIQIEYPD